MNNGKIEIEIQSDVVGNEGANYELSFQGAYIDDVYIVLRDIIHRMESGALHSSGALTMLDNDGTPMPREEFMKYMSTLKEHMDAEQNKNDDLRATPADFSN